SAGRGSVSVRGHAPVPVPAIGSRERSRQDPQDTTAVSGRELLRAGLGTAHGLRMLCERLSVSLKVPSGYFADVALDFFSKCRPAVRRCLSQRRNSESLKRNFSLSGLLTPCSSLWI